MTQAGLAAEIARLRERVEDHERRLAELEGKPESARDARFIAGVKGSLGDLIESGFFNQKKSIAGVTNELKRLGSNVSTTDISGYLRDLVKAKRLDRVKEKLEGRVQFAYFSPKKNDKRY
jgi:hypothetical protein